MSQHDATPDGVSRRRFLQLGGAAGAAAFLAASGATSVAAGSRRSPAAGRSRVAEQEASPVVATDGAFRMATWIGYIDIADDTSYPSLDRFTAETGVVIDYQEVVDDNQVFFASDLQGPIDAGVPTGWDIVVLTDWMIQRLVALGWLETIGASAHGNLAANLETVYRSRAWDPDNTLAAPYVSGMTGLGYDRKVTGDITSLSVLFGDTYSGRVTYLSEMNDTVGLVAILKGYDPNVLTQEQFDDCIALVKSNVDSGVVRNLTGNSYIEDMQSGDVQLAMAWSGDVAGLLLPSNNDQKEFVWTLADEGGMIWTDNMAIPKGAENQPQAERFIDWYYDPANAAQIIAFVRYVCPVKGAAEALAAIDPSASQDPLIFPTQEMRARLHDFISQDPDARSAWEATFQEAIGL